MNPETIMMFVIPLQIIFVVVFAILGEKKAKKEHEEKKRKEM